ALRTVARRRQPAWRVRVAGPRRRSAPEPGPQARDVRSCENALLPLERGSGGILQSTLPGSISELQQQLAAQHYVADQGLAVSLFLALRLRRPIFLEGEAGVGKTSLAAAAAAALDADLIRLQCYEGLDVSHAVYEWDYARQLLELRILDATGGL